MKGIIKIKKDFKKAKSIMQMVGKTTERIDQTNVDDFSAQICRDYYEIIRELICVVLLLDGYKSTGKDAHKNQITFLERKYNQFTSDDIEMINSLRILRNKIMYDGFFVKANYVKRNTKYILLIIKKLHNTIKKKSQNL